MFTTSILRRKRPTDAPPPAALVPTATGAMLDRTRNAVPPQALMTPAPQMNPVTSEPPAELTQRFRNPATMPQPERGECLRQQLCKCDAGTLEVGGATLDVGRNFTVGYRRRRSSCDRKDIVRQKQKVPAWATSNRLQLSSEVQSKQGLRDYTRKSHCYAKCN